MGIDDPQWGRQYPEYTVHQLAILSIGSATLMLPFSTVSSWKTTNRSVALRDGFGRNCELVPAAYAAHNVFRRHYLPCSQVGGMILMRWLSGGKWDPAQADFAEYDAAFVMS